MTFDDWWSQHRGEIRPARMEDAVREVWDAAVAAERERDAAASKQAWVDVLAERCRQIEVEGWTPDHDDRHRDGSLAKAAYCYAWAACGLGMESPPPAPPGWPWAGTWWKPRDTRSNLVRAAALLLAEIDRLDRQAGEKTFVVLHVPRSAATHWLPGRVVQVTAFAFDPTEPPKTAT